MTILTNRRELAFKIGTAGSYDSGVESASYATASLSKMETAPNIDFFTLNPITPILGTTTSLPGVASHKLDISAYGKTSGVAGTPPSWGPYLRACGFSETITPGTSVVYRPISTGYEVGDVAYYEGVTGSSAARILKLHDVMGTVVFKWAKVGNPLEMDYSFIGLPVTDTLVDGTMIQGTKETTLPPTFKGVSASIYGDSSPACFSSFTVDIGNTLAVEECPMQNYGAESVTITGRQAKATIDPKSDLVANANFVQKLYRSTLGSIVLETGGTPGNRIKLEIPYTQITAIKQADSQGIARDSLSLQVNKAEDGSASEIIVTVW